ncbi:RNA-binding protein 7 [Periplaneta americana]|uniref:RNA-binding protein 7 n=1 Tax=Periplaneta americana TaxID=6978 RepID=UPI0037E92A9D
MDEDKRTVWCGNLSEKVTEEVLYELFLQAGPLEKVRIPKDRDGRQRNFGFITFKHECSVPYSVALFEGTSLFNKLLILQSRNGTSVDVPQVGVGRNIFHGSERQRTQSLPINFGNAPAAATAVPDYNLLLQLGQQMLVPGTFGSMPVQLNPFGSFPPTNSTPLYRSQMSSSYYLGGNIDKVSKNSRDNHGHNRNHPYPRGGGSRGHEYNHNSNGRHSNTNSSNSHHHRDNGHRGSGGRRRY